LISWKDNGGVYELFRILVYPAGFVFSLLDPAVCGDEIDRWPVEALGVEAVDYSGWRDIPHPAAVNATTLSTRLAGTMEQTPAEMGSSWKMYT
jgi:hypothetical protein